MPAIMMSATIATAGSLPAATFTDVTQLREYESAATDHWIFDRGSGGNLTGLKAAITLTQIGATAPTHNAKSLTLASAVNNQLSTGVADGLTYTWCAVVKVPALNQGSGVGQALFSTYGGTANGGANFNIQGGTAVDMNSRAIISAAVVSNNVNITDVTVGAWNFYAFAVDHSGSNRLRRLVSGSASTDLTDTAALTPHGTTKLGLGATSSDFGNGAEFAEAIYFGGVALTLAQIAAIYARSKVRLLRRSGLTVI